MAGLFGMTLHVCAKLSNPVMWDCLFPPLERCYSRFCYMERESAPNSDPVAHSQHAAAHIPD